MENYSEVARQYRARAISSRSLASTMSDENSRKILMGVAQDYERMAELVDQMAEDIRQGALRGFPANST